MAVGVARDILQRMGDRHGRSAAAHHDHQLRLVIHLLTAGRQLDGLLGADHGGTEFVEDDR